MNFTNRCFSILLLLLPAAFNPVFAQTKLASIFTDNMVLQQKDQVSLWGWDKPGKKIIINTSWNHKSYTASAGTDGKWIAKVATPAASKQNYTISFNNGAVVTLNNILIGEVWLCTGQSNMEMPLKGFKGQPVSGSNDLILKSANPYLRIYTVPRSSITTEQANSKPSPWKVAGPEAVSSFSATGYIFGKLLQEMLDIPIGLVNVSYGGSSAQAWMSAGTLKEFPEIKVPAATDTIKLASKTPTTLYNGMVHPVVGYGIRGAIWYQGESNSEDPKLYEKLFPAMVKEWRTEWGGKDFPFYYAQIAPYNYKQKPVDLLFSAYLRDIQRKSVAIIPNSAMAVLMDIGEEKSIHPANKEAGGKRLALLALSNTYGMKGFGAESPAYQSLTIDGNTAAVKFTHAENGLTTFGKELNQFEVAGADQHFYPAKAVIKAETVLVSAPEVTTPVAVRYAFRDFIIGVLYGNDGLPVSSFRTDNW